MIANYLWNHYKLEMIDLSKVCFQHTIRESTDPFLSNNGGDYEEWEQIVYEGGVWVKYYYSSYDGEYCLGCGRYGDCSCDPEEIDLAELLRILEGPITIRASKRDPQKTMVIY